MPAETEISRKELQYHIIDIASQYYGVLPEDMTSNHGRFINQETAYKKHVCYYLLRKYTFLSYGKIGELFNKKDHAPVKWGVNKIDDLLAYDYRTITEIAELKKLVNKFKAKLQE